MLDPRQFRDFIVTPSLKRLEPVVPWTLAAENLVLGTALHESQNLTYIDQLEPGPGPAFGFWQMELPTYEDLWRNFISARVELAAHLLNTAGYRDRAHPPIEELHTNDAFACAMCRIQYLRAPDPLPAADDALALATYYKRWYNTELGKATVAQALPAFEFAARKAA